MNDEIKEKLNRIFKDLPSENACLDYKVIPYKEEEQAEFIKDLNGFLNSIDGYNQDKYIIIGIIEQSGKYVKLGLKDIPMNDDNFYQGLADKISPRPSIETGRIKYKENNEEYEFGYIYIPKDKNDNRVYTINIDYPKEESYVDDIRKGIKRPRVYASTAWIRWGSVNRPLQEDDRRQIYEVDKVLKARNTSYALGHYDLSKIESNNNALKMATLLGGWDENNENDKQIVSSVVGQPYEELIAGFRLMLKEDNTSLAYKNGKWKIEDRMNLLNIFAEDYFPEDISLFQSKVIEVLSQPNPKFDLEAEQRMMASLYGKEQKYSELLKQSIVETLPMLSSIINNFSNCKETVKYLAGQIINSVFENNDWKVWATLDSVLPFFAEANPEVFLNRLEEKIAEKSEELEELMVCKERNIVDTYYTTGLYWALQLIAWDEKYLIRVCDILAKLSKYDKKSKDYIIGIILPWYPQTKASIDCRKRAMEIIIKEDEDCGWYVISKLMPKETTIGMPSYKPKWNNTIDEEKEEVLLRDYWKQIENYLNILIRYAKIDVKRLCDLIDLLDDVSKNMFKKIIAKLSQKSIKQLSEDKKYILWNHLEDFITRHIKFKDADWALPNESLNDVRELSNELKPTSQIIYNKRFFRRDAWTLYDERGGHKEFERKLYDLRVKIARDINELGFERLIEFAKNVEDSRGLGECIAEIINEIENEEKILNCLDLKNEKLVLFAQGFAYKKFGLFGYDWLNRFNIIKWNKSKKINLLIVLPSNRATWGLVSTYLGKYQNEYWRVADIRFVDEDSDANYPIQKLLEVNRPAEVLDIMNYRLYDKKDYNKELAIEALEKMLNKQDDFKGLDSYHITEIIKDLQNSNISKDKLFKLEWSYLVLLDNIEGRPITIERELSEKPETYNEILSLAYKKHNVSKEEAEFVDPKIATNAYRLLHQWEIVPGIDGNGKVNKAKLNNWYKKMIEICTESDRLEVALLNFGKVLCHSPEDKSGLWIDKNVAEILNGDDANASIIRDGFRTEKFNSLGVITIDSEGKVFDNLAVKYEEEAKSIEKAGYHRIATVMRDLANSYKDQAERERERRYNEDN